MIFRSAREVVKIGPCVSYLQGSVVLECPGLLSSCRKTCSNFFQQCCALFTQRKFQPISARRAESHSLEKESSRSGRVLKKIIFTKMKSLHLELRLEKIGQILAFHNVAELKEKINDIRQVFLRFLYQISNFY